MTNKPIVEELNIALDLLKTTTPPLNKRKQHQKAITALEGVKEWAALANDQINALQEEVTQCHLLLCEIGVGGTHSPI